MSLFSLRQKPKNRTIPYFVQTMCWFMLAWIFLLSITLTQTVHYSLDTLRNKIDEILHSTAYTLAESRTVQDALQSGVCPEELTVYLDNVVANTTDLDMITIADKNAIRIYHINREQIGKTFVGGDEQDALMGQRYYSDATGTMGYQHRYFCPVYSDAGEIIGFVMTSTTFDRMDQLQKDISTSYGRIILVMFSLTLVLSVVMTVYLQRTLRGASPDDLVKTYLTQNDILNSLDEGLVSLDETGKIRLVNQAALETLNLPEDQLVGRQIDELLYKENGETLLGIDSENVGTNRPNLLVNSIDLSKTSKWARQVLILKDKSEAFRQAEQLNGTRHIVSALRANNHEFINRIQVISGLLQMGRAEEAQEYIGELSAIHAQTIAPVMQLIHNANVAALILGKLGNMRELDIHMTLLANSHLPEHSRYLSTQDLVMVVGNLLENAVEAVNAVTDSRPRSVVLQITEDDNGLLIQVSDSGIGIDDAVLPHVYEVGFSTKASEGRGVGMSLIRDAVERRKGTIEVDTEPGCGTTFTLIFNQPRGGKPI